MTHLRKMMLDDLRPRLQSPAQMFATSYKTIACVGFESGSHTVRERFKGYEQAVCDVGLEPVLHSKVGSMNAMQTLVDK